MMPDSIEKALTVQQAQAAATKLGVSLHTQLIWRLSQASPVVRSKVEQAILDGNLYAAWGQA